MSQDINVKVEEAVQYNVNIEDSIDINVSVDKTGPPGQGVPAAGTTGQSLFKSSNSDYDTEWKGIIESDISDLDKYTQLEVDNLLDDKVDTTTYNGHVNDSDIHFSDALADGNQYVRKNNSWEQVDVSWEGLSGDQSSINLSGFTNDSGYITGYTVTQADVTQHEASLTITESQISDLSHTSPAGSDGQLQFNNSGSFGADAGLVWDNTNDRLGIGTTTPSEKLHVSGAGARFTLEDTNHQKSLVMLLGSNAFTMGVDNTGAFSIDHDAPNGSIDIGARFTSKLDFAGSASQNLTLKSATNGTAGTSVVIQGYNGSWQDVFRAPNTASGDIDVYLAENGGNVGIGTTTPNADLDVVSSEIGIHKFLNFSNPNGRFEFTDGASGGGALGISGYPLTGSYPVFLVGNTHAGGDTGNDPLFRVSGRVNNNTVNTRPLFGVANVNNDVFMVHNDGKVGIGTSTPSFALDVSGDMKGNDLTLQTARPELNFDAVDEASSGVVYNFLNLKLTNDTTTETIGKFGVFGGFNQGGTPSANYIYITSDGADNHSSSPFKIFDSGEIAIGTADSTTPSGKLKVDGDAEFTGKLHVAGNVYIEDGKLIMDSATKQWEIAIDDSGNLTTNEIL